MKQGTPKTMKEAIENGVRDCESREAHDPELKAHIIETHVRDFLAQKFAATMLSDDCQTVSSLWQHITKKAA